MEMADVMQSTTPKYGVLRPNMEMYRLHDVALHIWICPNMECRWRASERRSVLPSGAKAASSACSVSLEGLLGRGRRLAARSLGRVRVSPWSRRECSFSWLMVMDEKGQDRHLYVCSPERKNNQGCRIHRA